MGKFHLSLDIPVEQLGAFITANREFISWEDLRCTDVGFSEELLREFHAKSNLDRLTDNDKMRLSEEIFRKYTDVSGLEWLILVEGLSKEIKLELLDLVNWDWISTFRRLSEDFIREYQDRVNWENISKYQVLSESFIREFQDKVDWF